MALACAAGMFATGARSLVEEGTGASAGASGRSGAVARADCNRESACGAKPARAYSSLTQGAWPLEAPGLVCKTTQGACPWARMVSHTVGCAASRRSEEHTSELQSLRHLVCRLLLEK